MDKTTAATKSIAPKRSRRVSKDAHPAPERALSVAAEIPSGPVGKETTTSKAAQPERSSFASALASIGKAALAETKRAAQLAALKARSEKARRIDLPKGLYDLGRKRYEARSFEEMFEHQYKELEELAGSINKKRQGAPIAPVYWTVVERAKAVAQNVAGKAVAEALVLRFKPLFIELGEAAAQQQPAVPEVEEEFETVKKVKAHIAEMEAEYVRLFANHAAQRELRNPFISFARDAGVLCQKARVGAKNGFVRRFSQKPALPAAIAICLTFLLGTGLVLDKAFNRQIQIAVDSWKNPVSFHSRKQTQPHLAKLPSVASSYVKKAARNNQARNVGGSASNNGDSTASGAFHHVEPTSNVDEAQRMSAYRRAQIEKLNSPEFRAQSIENVKHDFMSHGRNISDAQAEEIVDKSIREYDGVLKEASVNDGRTVQQAPVEK